MLLYDLPLLKQSLSTKCVAGLFTKPRQPQHQNKQQLQWVTKKPFQTIICKPSSFQIYKFKKTSKSDKIDMVFIQSIQLHVQICNIQIMTTKISECKEYIDIIIITLTTGELLVYYFSKDTKSFICGYREIIFLYNYNENSQKPQHKTFINNPRHIGNYITCSQNNHFLITSIRCHRRLFHITLLMNENRLKLIVKPYEINITQNHICWNVIWLPSMNNQIEYYGKYIAIEKEIVVERSVNQIRREEIMLDESQEQITGNKTTPAKKLRYYYIDRGTFRLIQRQQKKPQFKQLRQTSHMLIPITSSSFFILSQNRLLLKQLTLQDNYSKQDANIIIEIKFPLRESLVDKNKQAMFSCYSKAPKQNADGNKNRIYLMNEFGDLFGLEYILIGGLVANFSIKYANSLRTVHSIVYIGEVESIRQIKQSKQKQKQSNNNNNKQGGRISLSESSQPFPVSYENASLILFGLQRFSASLYFLPVARNIQCKPKQIKVAIRQTTKTKSIKIYPDISYPQCYKPIIQRSRDLDLSDQIQHMGVISDMKVANLRHVTYEGKDKEKQDIYEIFILTNGGNLRHEEHIEPSSENVQSHKSYLKIIKKGLKVKQTNSINYQKPFNFYSFKKSQKDSYHKIVVICNNIKTVPLMITSDNSLASYRDIIFEENGVSYFIGKFEDDTYVQVLSTKIRHIKKQKSSPKDYLMQKNKIINGICLGKQLFVALYGGQIFYYQLDKDKDILQLRKQFYTNDQVITMEMTPLQIIRKESVQKRVSRFLIVATKNYQLIIFKIKGQKQATVERIYEEKLKIQIQSLCSTIGYSDETNNNVIQKTYFIFVGLQNGSFIKMEFDKYMHKITQKVFNVGAKPCKLKRSSLGSKREDSVIVITDKTYLCYPHKNKWTLLLLACPNIQLAVELKQPQNLSNLMVYSQGSLRFLFVESFGQQFHDQKVDLFFSGKKLLIFQNNVGVIQADPSYELFKSNPDQNIDIENSIIQVKKLQKVWKSQFTIYKIKNNKRVSAIYFDQTKQVCLSAAYNHIKNGNNKGSYLIFGCAEGISFYPKFQTKNQTIKIYSWLNEDNKNEFLYSLDIDSVPLVLQPFSKGDKFLAGIGKSLRLYEIARKKLLLKAEIKNLSSNVNQIKTYGKKIYITSVSDSFHLYKYIPQQQTFYDIAQDNLPKFITAMAVIDSQTVCAGDKFGNLIIGRLSENAKNQFDSLTDLTTSSYSSNYLSKFNTLATINVGDVVTSIFKTKLYNSKVEVILYSTIMGQLRVLYPLGEVDEMRVLPELQLKLRRRLKIVHNTGNNLGSSKNVINGQIVSKYLTLPIEEQFSILKQIIPYCKIDDVDHIKEMIQGIRNKII